MNGAKTMYFETKPFHEYEAITIDDLKDQTNSLLNLVTEELRSLTVTMENGKEFLLFSRELLDPLYDHDFRLILVAATRYSMGKNTAIPLTVAQYIRRDLRLLDAKALALAINDIRSHLTDYGALEPNPELWQNLLSILEAHQKGELPLSEKPSRPCPSCGAPLEVMSIADSYLTTGGFDVIAHCRQCASNYEWFRDSEGNDSEMKRYFFG